LGICLGSQAELIFTLFSTGTFTHFASKLDICFFIEAISFSIIFLLAGLFSFNNEDS